MASCGFALASDDAVFGLSEVNWGALPAGLVSKVLAGHGEVDGVAVRHQGADPFDGRRAAEVRLVNKSVPAERLREEVMALAEHLASLDEAAVRATKEAFKQVVDMSYDQAYWFLMSKSNELRWRHQESGRGSEGIEKFLAKEYRPGMGSFTKTGRLGACAGE